MADAFAFEVTVFEDAGFTVMARVNGEANTAVKQADITSIVYTVTDVTDGTVTNSGTVTVATAVFDTLQTDARWTEDTTGYNFRHHVPAAAVPEGERLYMVEYLFTMGDGTVIVVQAKASTLKVWRT